MSSARFAAIMVATSLASASAFALPAQAAPGDRITLSEHLVTISGLATDHDRGLYWVAPAKASSQLKAFDREGHLAGQVNFDAELNHIEAVSYAQGSLYVGDIGDENSDTAQVIRLESTDFDARVPYTTWTLRYPDGPHKAKAMAVSPRGNFYIFTFGSPGGVYLAENAGFPGEIEMRRLGDAPDWITDAVFVSDEDVVVRSYQTFSGINMHDLALITRGSAPDEPQGESLAISLDGNLISSSYDSADLIESAIPSTLEDVAVIGTEQPPSAQNEIAESSNEEAGVAKSESRTTSRKAGAIAGALLLAIAAGVTAYLSSGGNISKAFDKTPRK